MHQLIWESPFSSKFCGELFSPYLYCTGSSRNILRKNNGVALVAHGVDTGPNFLEPFFHIFRIRQKHMKYGRYETLMLIYCKKLFFNQKVEVSVYWKYFISLWGSTVSLRELVLIIFFFKATFPLYFCVEFQESIFLAPSIPYHLRCY